MAHSLEVRLPYLSHELVEFVFSLPSTYKIHNGWTKWIMRTAYEKLLPKEIAWRKDKIGYEPPQTDWLKKREVRDLIQTSKRVLVDNGILHRNVIDVDRGSEAGDSWKDWTYWMAGSLLKNG
jgi:asparagine synthase (glutamine-hydrolysing)